MTIWRSIATAAGVALCVFLLNGCLGTAREETTAKTVPSMRKEEISKEVVRQMTLVDCTSSLKPVQKIIGDSRSIGRILSLWNNADLKESDNTSSGSSRTLFSVTCPDAPLIFTVETDGIRYRGASYQTPPGFLQQLQTVFNEAMEEAVPYTGL